MSETHAADADPAALLATLASEDPAIAELVALTADVEPTLARVGAATGLPLAADRSRPDEAPGLSGHRAAVVVCDDATTDLAPVARAAAALPAGSIVLLAAPRDGSSVGAAAALIAFSERGWTPEGRDHAAGEGAWAVFRLERRDFAIRLAVAADLPVLERLERDCWAPGLQMPTRTLARRIERFPLGQLVLEHAGAVVGAVYSQRIAEPRFEGVTATDVHRLHRPDGPVLQLLALNIAPTVQDRAYGDVLLEFALERAATLPGVEAIVGVTRCKDAGKRPDLSHADYIALTNPAGRRLDPVLRMHELHGAEIIGPVEGYRPKDAVNGGAGVLVRYDPKRRQRRAIEPQTITSPSADVLAMDAPPRDALAPVREAIATVLGRGGPDAVPPTAPLFELGLDSADLLDLNERLSAVFGRMIEPAFFFEHNTAARIAAALDRDGATRAPIETTESVTAKAGDVRREDIAIVGLACRLPGGVGSPEAFWQLLAEGRNAVGARPADRWAWPAGFDPATHPGIDRGGFLDDVARFDAAFFRISPKEARVMDPQQRLLLEAAWTAFEDAGWRPSDLAGSDTGVFVGASGSDYHLRLAEAETEIEGHYALGASMAVLANRISYFFDFDGPSLQIDTACSSSLVALNEAVAALRAGTCGRALVAGVNVLCHAAASIGYWRAGMLSKDGRCKTFDAAADGYVRGEGVVALVLKPLAAALADGDRIEAVIKGTATNHGGQAAGLTVPNPARQADLVRKALAAAGIGPETISYIEAHGTGTALGDPIEVRGLKQAFGVSDGAGPDGAAAPVCLIGSVKTNIGHLEAAAGLAGLIKTVLALRAGTIPASLNFSTLNPHLSFEGSRFAVTTAATPGWRCRARRAGRA
ncbi:beta-ketoacyl synthase N-terminal-like domain-containing protein [Methyloraptor flagellatus]|uniref:Type I polyketide synthase n=1 Tax=Methyloraptor flagellatus TaxID=3162530 RepID=A0AAU7XEK2_9HYPH